MCDFIQNYIQDGNYEFSSEIYPSCRYPEGAISSGYSIISSSYDCEFPTKFLQKKIETNTLNSVSGQIISFQSFNIECVWIHSNNFGYNLSGKYKLCSGNRILICSRGYFSITGKIESVKTYFEATSTGYVETSYYNNNGVWTPIIKKTYIKI